MFDFWGEEIRRFYQLDTLASATEWVVKTSDRFIVPTVQDILGPAAVSMLSFELFQEGRFQLIFHMRAANEKRSEAEFAYVVAKRARDFSELARGEHRNLTILNERAPNQVVQPYRGGIVFMPDRHQRPGHGREVYAYLTQWLSGYHEMGVTRELQFYINTATPHTFTIDQTEAIKGQIVEIIARTYEPRRGSCMDMPQVASGDFVVTAPSTSDAIPRIKLIACRRLLNHMTPAKILHRIVTAKYEWAQKHFRLCPAFPETVLESLTTALGSEQARVWLMEYRAAVSARRLPECPPLTLDALAELNL